MRAPKGVPKELRIELQLLPADTFQMNHIVSWLEADHNTLSSGVLWELPAPKAMLSADGIVSRVLV